MIIRNPYWIIKCANIPLPFSFPESFNQSGFCHSVFVPKCLYEEICPACQGYRTVYILISPLPPRRVRDPNVNGWLNFVMKFTESPGELRERVVSGNRDQYKMGLRWAKLFQLNFIRETLWPLVGETSGDHPQSQLICLVPTLALYQTPAFMVAVAPLRFSLLHVEDVISLFMQ